MKKAHIHKILAIAALVFLAWSFEPAWSSPDSCCDEKGGCCETMMAPGSCAHCYPLTVSWNRLFGGDTRSHSVFPNTDDSRGLVNPNDIWRPPAA